jgi:hypothetical protein
MPAGLVIIHGRAHGARIAAQPAEAVGARCKPPGQIRGLAAVNAVAVTRGMSRATIYRKIHQHGIITPAMRPRTGSTSERHHATIADA